MKTIRRVILAVALALIFVAGVNAQETCRVKVVIVCQNWDGSGENQYGRMTANQVEWWRSEGQKKFPKICLVSTRDEADYGIAWSVLQSADKHVYTAPNTSTTQHNGTVVGPGGVGTYSGTSTTTTDERREGEWPVTHVNAAVFKNGGSDIPMFVAKNKGQWRWSKPDKDAFEKSLKFIQKQLK